MSGNLVEDREHGRPSLPPLNTLPGKNPAGHFPILDFETTLLGREAEIRELDDFVLGRTGVESAF